MGNIYVGINNIARKVSSIYIGVNNVAKKVSKGYIGINNIARLFYKSYQGVLVHGEAPRLGLAKSHMASATIGNYAIFAGGYNKYSGRQTDTPSDTSSSDPTNTVEAYNTSLSKSTCANLRNNVYHSSGDGGGTAIGNYAIFGGGSGSGSNVYSTVDTYNTSLTKGVADNLSVRRGYLSATSVGDYALFGGGCIDGHNVYSTVDTYNTSLTKGVADNLSSSRYQIGSSAVGNYAIFAGGHDLETAVDSYSSSLTHSIPFGLSYSHSSYPCVTIGNYALIPPTDNSLVTETCNISLTKGTASSFSVSKWLYAGTSVKDYAIFAGGYAGNNPGYTGVDKYNTSLTRSGITGLINGRQRLEGATVGDYALFAGGTNYTYSYYTVDYYQYT